MPFKRRHQLRHFRLLIGVLALTSCASELAAPVGASRAALELECASVAADASGDILAILSSSEPLDASRPQAYGSSRCAGAVFEFDNPEAEPLRGAWIQASGESSESRCGERRLEADYWGYEDREWTRLASASSSGRFERHAGYCQLDALIEHAAAFEKLRVVARVTQGEETYPMYACVW